METQKKIPTFDQLINRSTKKKKRRQRWYVAAASISILIYIGLGSWFGMAFLQEEKVEEVASISNWQSPTDFSKVELNTANSITTWEPTTSNFSQEEDLMKAISDWQSPTDFLLSN